MKQAIRYHAYFKKLSDVVRIDVISLLMMEDEMEDEDEHSRSVGLSFPLYHKICATTPENRSSGRIKRPLRQIFYRRVLVILPMFSEDQSVFVHLHLPWDTAPIRRILALVALTLVKIHTIAPCSFILDHLEVVR